MRVRLTPRTDSPVRRSRGISHRRGAVAPAEPAARPVPVAALPPGHLVHEQRLRASGGPDDRALYGCTCGFAFHADVSTSVACPHCGSAQAW